MRSGYFASTCRNKLGAEDAHGQGGQRIATYPFSVISPSYREEKPGQRSTSMQERRRWVPWSNKTDKAVEDEPGSAHW